MYCPECLTEYREGFSQCADCRVPLMAGVPLPKPAKTAAPELVTVLETADAFAVGLAKASLEDAGIEYEINGKVAKPSRGTPMYRVQVTREDEADARVLLEPLQNPEIGEGEA